jgi:hypothetical protein
MKSHLQFLTFVIKTQLTEDGASYTPIRSLCMCKTPEI